MTHFLKKNGLFWKVQKWPLNRAFFATNFLGSENYEKSTEKNSHQKVRFLILCWKWAEIFIFCLKSGQKGVIFDPFWTHFWTIFDPFFLKISRDFNWFLQKNRFFRVPKKWLIFDHSFKRVTLLKSTFWLFLWF